MSPEQVMQFRAWAKDHGTFSVVGGFGETLDGALIREMIQQEFGGIYPKAAMDTKKSTRGIDQIQKG